MIKISDISKKQALENKLKISEIILKSTSQQKMKSTKKENLEQPNVI